MNGLVALVPPETLPQPIEPDESPELLAGRLELAISQAPLRRLARRVADPVSRRPARPGSARRGGAARPPTRRPRPVRLPGARPDRCGPRGVGRAQGGRPIPRVRTRPGPVPHREGARLDGPRPVRRGRSVGASGRAPGPPTTPSRSALSARPSPARGGTPKPSSHSARPSPSTPTTPSSHVVRAHVRLALGDDSAWHETEWRTRTAAYAPAVPTATLPWDGTSSPGLRLLLIAEPEDEDTIFFVRYASRLRDLGVETTLACPPTLATLLAGVDGLERVATGEVSYDEYDAYAFLGSLPSLLPTADEAGPPAASLAGGGARVRGPGPPTGLKVAVHWRARPDDRRSFPLLALAPLAGIGGVSLVSVQEGGAEEIAEAGVAVLDLGPPGAAGPLDFEGLAAVLRGVDLVVTNDGPVAHLAGALGVPTWVALPVGPEWIWAGDAEETPWYPSLRLFRQRRADDWDDAFRLMETELKVRLAAGHAERIGPPALGLEPDPGAAE